MSWTHSARLLARAVVVVLVTTAITVPPAAGAATDLLVHYALEQTSGTVVTDSSGNGRDAALVGGGTWNGAEGLKLDGTSGHVKLPDDLMRGLSAISVSTQVRLDAAQATPYFLWGMGNTGSDGVGNGYLFATGDGYRAGLTTGNWSGEQVVSGPSALPRARWVTATYTLGDGTAVLYLDGVEVARKTGVTTTPGQIGAGTTRANYLGRSVYTADRYLSGSVRDFRVYNRALTAAEASALSGTTDEQRVARDAAALSLGDTSAVTQSLTLPAKGPNGSTITWTSSAPKLVAADGTVTRPAPGTADGKATLTAKVASGAVTATKAFDVVVKAQQTTAQLLDEAVKALTVVNADDVRGNLTLPTTGLNGTTVTWASNNTKVITATGVVTRPATKPASVQLTATVRLGNTSATRKFDVTVRPRPAAEPMQGYAFAYFTGNTKAGENIYFAASRGNNALQWDEVNGGKAALTSTMGEKGLRDPFLIRSPEGDKFFLIATDLSIGGGTSWDTSQRQGSRYIEVWESTDLVTWSEQRHVLVSPETAGNTWAPEAYWSPELGAYVVYWASKIYAANDPQHTGNTYNRMLYATTRDFRTFSPTKTWQDFGSSRIDSTVISDGGTYYRFTKDEGGVTGCSDIIQERNASLTEADDVTVPGWDPKHPAWETTASCIGRAAGTSAVEGPTVFAANPGDTSGSKYYLFVDEYGGRGYIPLGSQSLATPSWRVPASYHLPASPRHGTVIPVSARELAALRQEPDALKATSAGLIASYPGAVNGTHLTDSSGNGNDATVVNGATTVDGALKFDGADDHVKLPDNMMARLDSVSVAAEVWIDPAQPKPYFLWGMGNTGPDGAGNGYLFATGDEYRASISPGNWTGEQTVKQSRALGRGAWHQLTYTLSGSTAKLWLDGVEVARKDDVTVRPRDIGGGRTTANYLGRSVYTADRYFQGKMRNVSVWNRELTGAQIGALPGNATRITGVTLDSLKVPAIIDGDAGTVVLPVKPGTDVRKLAPKFTIGANSRINPASGWTRDFTKPQTYTVRATDGSTRTWTVSAVVMGSPVLPGFNADPNIVRFGDTYYIYATTDGLPGWSSSKFTVWSSKNLRDWTEHPTILDLGPDVTWADANAWAPTATEKNGKYYFYFSAQQSIGVAVSDSPLGPFVDSGKPFVDKANYQGRQQIDPAVFTDDDGKSYLYWGNGAAYVVPLNADMVSYDQAKVKQINGLTDFREGMFMTKRNGMYHLTWSIDDTGSENYRVGYAVVSDPLATTVQNKGVILSKRPELGILGTGHHSIVQVPETGEWYIAYHRFGIPGGDGTHRETTIDKLVFGADGTITPVVPTLESVPALVPMTVTTATACHCNRPEVSVSVRNTGDTALQVVVNTPWGERQKRSLAAGQVFEATFTPPSRAYSGTTVTVTATPPGGSPRTITTTIPAASCAPGALRPA
jgi:glycosyl hydrolase family 43/aBig family protein/concanavalin A-like lectin/glucanase superfamily protein